MAQYLRAAHTFARYSKGADQRSNLIRLSVALHLNKLEPPSLKDAFFQVWLKLTQWLLYRRSIHVYVS